MSAYSELWSALTDTDIDFAEESWQNAPSGDYGVLLLSGNQTNRYADDELVFQETDGEVHLYTRDAGGEQSALVESAIRSVEDVTVRMSNREYLSDWNMIHYTWLINVVTA